MHAFPEPRCANRVGWRVAGEHNTRASAISLPRPGEQSQRRIARSASFVGGSEKAAKHECATNRHAHHLQSQGRGGIHEPLGSFTLFLGDSGPAACAPAPCLSAAARSRSLTIAIPSASAPSPPVSVAGVPSREPATYPPQASTKSDAVPSCLAAADTATWSPDAALPSTPTSSNAPCPYAPFAAPPGAD